MTDFLLAIMAGTFAATAGGTVYGTAHARDRMAATGAAPHLFDSVAVPLRQSPFSRRWQRVVRQARPVQLLNMVSPARLLGRDQQVRFVNASMNRHISHRFDTHPSGDQWATVNETLERKAGDCEDIVVAKMQALRVLGVPAADLYMTIGHEGSAGAVHAILLVRIADRFWVLDNRIDHLVAQEDYKNFYPIFTFSDGSEWVHGYRGGLPPAVSGRNLPLGNAARSASGSAAPHQSGATVRAAAQENVSSAR